MFNFGYTGKEKDSCSKTIETVVSQIFTAIKPMIASSGTIVVNLGEIHNSPNNIVTETDFMNKLVEAEIPFSVALEREPNKLENVLLKTPNIKDVPRALSQIKQSGLHNTLIRQALIKSIKSSPISNSIQFSFMQNNNIPYHLVDTARTEKYGVFYLKQEDPKTNEALIQAKKIIVGNKNIRQAFNSFPNVNAESILAILARNIHMLRACKELSQNTKDIRVILLLTGSAHTEGSRDSPPKHSLANLFKYTDLPYIGTSLSSSEGRRVPPLISTQILPTSNIPAHLTVNSYEEQNQLDNLTLPWLKKYSPTAREDLNKNNTDFDKTIERIALDSQHP